MWDKIPKEFRNDIRDGGIFLVVISFGVAYMLVMGTLILKFCYWLVA